MAKQTWVNVGGTWRKVKSAWLNVNGVWKKDVMPKGVVNGNWKQFMSYMEFVYVSNGSSELARIDMDGEVVWSVEVNVNSLTSGIDNCAYVGGYNGYINKVDSKGQIIFEKRPITAHVRSIQVDEDGYIYIGGSDGYFYKLDSDCNIIWSAEGYSGNNVTNVLAIPNRYVIASANTSSTDYRITRVGISNGRYEVATSLGMGSNSSMTTDNSSLYSTGGRNLHKLSLSLSETGRETISPYGTNLRHLVTDGTYIYAGDDNGDIYKIDKNLNIVWTTRASKYNYFTRGLSITPNGRLYQTLYDETMYCLDSVDGSIIWSSNVFNSRNYSGLSAHAPFNVSQDLW